MKTEIVMSKPETKHELSNSAVASQARAIQEVQASLVMAKQFPRDVGACIEAIKVSCARPRLAAQAIYAYAKGGSDISGPSIRLAEALAQHWGNLEFGFRETDRGIDENGVGWSEVQTFCWDLQTNTRRMLQFRLKHWRDTKSGGYPLKDEREVYELMANMAQRRVRACILAVIPGDVVEEAEVQCEETLKANVEITPEAIKKMVDAFAKMGATRHQIEARIQRKVDAITPAQMIQLRKIHASIKDGMSEVGDWFAKEDEKASAEVDPFAEAKAATAAAKKRPEKPAEDKQDDFSEVI